MNHTSGAGSAWSATARSALLDRWTLGCNHVLRAESAATGRLAAWAGAVIVFQLPSLPSLDALPKALRPDLPLDAGPVVWQVTKAGLLELVPDAAGDASVAAAGDASAAASDEARRRVRITVREGSRWDQARALARGDASVFEVSGDDAIATDVRWVLDHVRWDAAGDVVRVLPEPLRAPAAKLADAASGALRSGARVLGSWWPRSAPPPPPSSR